MRFGYACINLSLKGKFNTCRLDRATERGIPLLRGLAYNNFVRTYEILQWNIKYGIPVYRLTSDLIPFGSHPVAEGWDWWNDDFLTPVFEEIRKLVRENDLRVTIHPGQYNILNSHSSQVVANTIKDLTYQNRLLEALGGTDMILHIGGHYGHKDSSAQRFINEFRNLEPKLQNVLRIENDDKTFTAADVMEIVDKAGALMMYDYHHDRCNPSVPNAEVREFLLNNWNDKRIKVHISSGRRHPRDLAHADYITEETWLGFKDMFDGVDLDVMVEAKDKELATFRLQTMHGSNIVQRGMFKG